MTKKSVFILCILIIALFAIPAFSLTGEIGSGDSIVFNIPIEEGRSPEQTVYINVKNTNDIDVEVFLMGVGAIQNEIELPESITIPASSDKDVQIVITTIHPGIYGGKISALFFATGEQSFRALSPNIILNVGLKSD